MKKIQQTKRKREDIVLDLSNVSPNGKWWTAPNIVHLVLKYLPVKDMIQGKTLCKNWFKVMNHQFVREYVASFLELDEDNLQDLEVMMNTFKTEKKMVSSYEAIIEQLKELDNSNDYSESVRSLLSKYEKSHSLDLLKEISKLTKKEIRNQNSLSLEPPKIVIAENEYNCQNYGSIRSILLSQDLNSIEQYGLNVTTIEKSYFIVLSNGYPMKLNFDYKCGRYDGHYKVEVNGTKAIRLKWFEGGFEENHNWEFIKLLKKGLDFKSDTPIEEDTVFLTILFAWLIQLFPEATNYEIPDSCFGESILVYSDLGEDNRLFADDNSENEEGSNKYDSDE
ncbi:predicted protein [Naegleria gruberi]|uniref:Predicted protein n=1 Tax=Naegleria gruberi TaxID=5762 RepID=D2VMY6_NAEGR|nr:uncharacterized protein NAEGRDRAFT_70308 [Naegleria gruberi]EFC41824.1 predicted protein [Naegleria gruberi]|eukprot:XP_002674568.1 predicted protein [Naegleria gruberi strain NEG-M]